MLLILFFSRLASLTGYSMHCAYVYGTPENWVTYTESSWTASCLIKPIHLLLSKFEEPNNVC